MEKLNREYRRRSKSLEDDYLTTQLKTTQSKLSEINDKYKKLYNENEQLKLDKETLEKEKDEVLSRFSKLAGQKLTKGNSDITDLSNPNRPAKIGERWGSLYTDEWTDAYEEIANQCKDKRNEDDTLPEKRLLKIVDWCYRKCKEIAEDQNKKIKDTLLEVVNYIHFLGTESPTPALNKPESGKFAYRILKIAMEPFEEQASAQSQTSSTLIDAVINKCVVDYSMSTSTVLPAEEKFLRKCSELCWLMGMTDPHMVIEYDDLVDREIDVNKFNKYSRNGTIVEYVVWPALLLSEGGTVVTKGTVQTNDKKGPTKHDTSNEDGELLTPCSANAANDYFVRLQCQTAIELKEDNEQTCIITHEKKNTVNLSYQTHDERYNNKHIVDGDNEVFEIEKEREEENKQYNFKSAVKSTCTTNDSQSKHAEKRVIQSNQATSRPENTRQEHDLLSNETDKCVQNFTDYTKAAVNVHVISIRETEELLVQTNKTLSDENSDDELNRIDALSNDQRKHSVEETCSQKPKYYLKDGMQKGNHTDTISRKLEQIVKTTKISRKLCVGKEPPTDH